MARGVYFCCYESAFLPCLILIHAALGGGGDRKDATIPTIHILKGQYQNCQKLFDLLNYIKLSNVAAQFIVRSGTPLKDSYRVGIRFSFHYEKIKSILKWN